MNQVFFLVIALFALLQIGEKVTAASIEASFGNNTESDQQYQIQYTEDEINSIVDKVTDSLINYFVSFKIEFHQGHENVTELIINAANLPDDAPEEVKTVVKSFKSTFNDKHAKMMALFDQYQEQGVQLLDSVRKDVLDALNKFISDINSAKEETSESLTA